LKKSRTNEELEVEEERPSKSNPKKLKKSRTDEELDDGDKRNPKKLKKSRTNEELEDSDYKHKKLKKSKTHDDLEDDYSGMREAKHGKLKKSKSHNDDIEVQELDEEILSARNPKKLKKSRSRGWD